MSTVAYRYRFKDSTSRKHLIRMAWAANRVWNYCNEISQFALRRDKCWLSAYDLHKLTAGCGKTLGLQSHTVQRICTEYVKQRVQHRKPRLRWRSRKRSLGWIPFKANGIRLVGDTVTYCGRAFRLWLSREVEGEIKEGSFTQDARGHWYINLNCDVEDRSNPLGQVEIGIDLGLSDQIACSDGQVYSRENLTRHYEDKLALVQRAKKKKRVTALHAKIKNVRKDWTHKVTTEIARRAKKIVVGDVSSTKLVRTRFAKSIYDAAWGITRYQLNYKAIRLAGVCVSGHEMFSSVTCSVCLSRSGPSGLSGLGVRNWRCEQCGARHDRDVNAARNILQFPYGTSYAA